MGEPEFFYLSVRFSDYHRVYLADLRERIPPGVLEQPQPLALGTILAASAYVETALFESFLDALWFFSHGMEETKEKLVRQSFCELYRKMSLSERIKFSAKVYSLVAPSINVDLGRKPWQDVIFLAHIRNQASHGIEPFEPVRAEYLIGAEELAAQTGKPVAEVTYADFFQSLRSEHTEFEKQCSRFFELHLQGQHSWERILSKSCAIWVLDTIEEFDQELKKWKTEAERAMEATGKLVRSKKSDTKNCDLCS